MLRFDRLVMPDGHRAPILRFTPKLCSFIEHPQARRWMWRALSSREGEAAKASSDRRRSRGFVGRDLRRRQGRGHRFRDWRRRWAGNNGFQRASEDHAKQPSGSRPSLRVRECPAALLSTSSQTYRVRISFNAQSILSTSSRMTRIDC